MKETIVNAGHVGNCSVWRYCCQVITAILLLGCTVYASAAPQVLTTIKPLQLIAQAVTYGVSQPDVLLPPGTSPHDFSMRPSDVLKLRQANIVLWVGPELESFLQPVLKQYAANSVSIAATQLPNIHVLHQEAAPHEHHSSINPHLWLDPNNALLIAEALRDRLCAQDSEHCQKYQKNAQHFKERLSALSIAHKSSLKTGFFVYHRAWDYLAQAYHLLIIDAFTVDPDFASGAAHLLKLRAEMKTAAPACVFVEPQFQPAVIGRVTQGLEMHKAALDPLATKVALDQDGYVNYLKSLLSTITTCVKQTAH